MPGNRTRWWRLRSVRARTTLVATVVVAVALVVAVMALVDVVEQRLIRGVLEQGQQQVDDVVGRLATGATPESALLPTQSPGGDAGLIQVAVLDGDGQAVAGDGFVEMAGADDVRVEDVGAGDFFGESDGPAPTSGEPRVVRVGTTDLAVAQQWVEVDGQLLYVVAASPLAEVVRGVDTMLQASMVGVPVLTLVVAVVTWIATGRTLKPIENIRNEVEELSSQTLERRLPVPASSDEVARLAETMNRMLARLDGAAVRQRQFVSDASHELRSPIASIRAEIEVALAHPDASSFQEIAAGVLTDTKRLERIVDDLLLLARLDEGAEPLNDAVDVAGLVREVVGQVDPVDVSVQLNIADSVYVRGRHDELESVVRNLLDNAVRHAKSAVTITGTTRDTTVCITVDDDGPGIPPADRERVFERFTRLEPARSRSDGGVGLGLAVVDRVVRHHDGSVAIDESPSGGARFTVELPAALHRGDPESADV